MSTDNKASTIRLVYPQWQGGGPIAEFIPELPAEDAYKGYFLGAQLLRILAPANGQRTVEVPVSLDIKDREEESGVISYRALLRQSHAALQILRQHDPDRIVTLGGECSVSVVPFTFLAEKYLDDVAIVWIDAHPDLNLPGEGHRGYHAMALAATMGRGDTGMMQLLPAKVDASKVLIVGLRAWEKEGGTPQRQNDFGVKSLSPAEVALDSSAVLEWLRKTGASKVLVHFDLDVIDPSDMIAAVGVEPNGMKVDEVVRLINDLAEHSDLVGLTVAEHMPRVAIKLQNMLGRLPLLKDG
ncbi:arginase family protein [Rhizobium puerariae]|uniref:Arginase family protein n=1 Tax=Rhizobium puerariae TaxID=1585791 RepID=A0ABV6AQJ1_9HYPH